MPPSAAKSFWASTTSTAVCWGSITRGPGLASTDIWRALMGDAVIVDMVDFLDEMLLRYSRRRSQSRVSQRLTCFPQHQIVASGAGDWARRCIKEFGRVATGVGSLRALTPRRSEPGAAQSISTDANGNCAGL